MDKKKPVDTANEPVDLYDDGMVDTGVLHEEDEEEGEGNDGDREARSRQ